MFRRATSTLLARAATARRFSTDVATPVENSKFIEAWKKVSPNLDPPSTPLAFMKPRPPTPNTIPTKLTVNFVLPYASQLAAKEVSLSLFSFRFVLFWFIIIVILIGIVIVVFSALILVNAACSAFPVIELK